MSHFARKRPDGPASEAKANRSRSRAPIIIGFEQLEGRAMLSAGLCLTIIPDQSLPLTIMPRPYVGSFNPESSMSAGASTLRIDSTAPREPDRWSPGRRFRWRGLDRG